MARSKEIRAGLRPDDLGGCAGADDPALVHDRQPVGERLGLVHVVRAQQDRGAVVQQVAEQPPDTLPALRVQPGGGLVQEQHLGSTQHGQRQVQSSSFAAGQLPHTDPGPVAQVDQFQGFPDRPRRGQRPGPHPRRLRHRQFRRKPAVLQHDPDPWPHRAAFPERGSRPSTRTVPDVAGASPSTTSSRDVFPAPLVPSNANSSPRRTEKLTPRTASNPRRPPL